MAHQVSRSFTESRGYYATWSSAERPAGTPTAPETGSGATCAICKGSIEPSIWARSSYQKLGGTIA